ncbi:uncharacterized protein BYT42DRAFT_609865 [Radiomyces spectabilis]|uniref:uncharacterized protein n=1 Tax=Radiomyces spectabilis TaxID=64574 RepID=UPI00221EEBCA|nr:uncharacterized protein BYT42DRAFT_609865 [Radiomyces spectabilis]KAI8394122.1 hypothetical protein BYT42DRAFT_609865 [Radiomyces spectabilis]
MASSKRNHGQSGHADSVKQRRKTSAKHLAPPSLPGQPSSTDAPPSGSTTTTDNHVSSSSSPSYRPPPILPKSTPSVPVSHPVISAFSPSLVHVHPYTHIYSVPFQIVPMASLCHPATEPPIPTISEKSAHQREQARKSSHSAIERRRRERINDQIMQLKQLIPGCSTQVNAHKLTVLQQAIDYIIYLQSILKEYEEDQKTNPAAKPINLSLSQSGHGKRLPLDDTQQRRVTAPVSPSLSPETMTTGQFTTTVLRSVPDDEHEKIPREAEFTGTSSDKVGLQTTGSTTTLEIDPSQSEWPNTSITPSLVDQQRNMRLNNLLC